MTLGEKLKHLRIKNNLTQKDLADSLHVTFQTVSKWENDTNEPDMATLKELAKLLNCPISYFYSDEEEVPVEQQEESVKQEVVEPAPQEVVTKTVIIHQKECHVCARCKKDIEDDNDLEIDHVCVRTGGRGRSAVYRDDYYHKECLKLTQKERAEAKQRVRVARGKHKNKIAFGWSIAMGAVALGVALGLFLGLPQCREVIHPGLTVLYSVLISYGVFADLYCILSGSYVADVFFGVAGWSIRMPGLIFTWDLDGIMWLIAMKILFLILGAMLTALVLAFAVSLSALLAAVSFPFVLIHNLNTHYDDAL